jgi:hypothetical protein
MPHPLSLQFCLHDRPGKRSTRYSRLGWYWHLVCKVGRKYILCVRHSGGSLLTLGLIVGRRNRHFEDLLVLKKSLKTSTFDYWQPWCKEWGILPSLRLKRPFVVASLYQHRKVSNALSQCTQVIDLSNRTRFFVQSACIFELKGIGIDWTSAAALRGGSDGRGATDVQE